MFKDAVIVQIIVHFFPKYFSLYDTIFDRKLILQVVLKYAFMLHSYKEYFLN